MGRSGRIGERGNDLDGHFKRRGGDHFGDDRLETNAEVRQKRAHNRTQQSGAPTLMNT